MITVSIKVEATLEKVWEAFTNPSHIKNWYFADDTWHAPLAENDLKIGGKFKTRMEAKDGSEGFDFEGIYKLVEEHKRFEYYLADNRKIKVDFTQEGNSILVTEQFDPEHINSYDLQEQGWQMILNNFKKYVEAIS
jgi:uncharacterized protein YndB with AHSA1/START domain